ncbi:unnamed protein product [Schistosoma mattheei]|uniref:Uncharacterized protein n=1 Tax=Schistosoma mattheei TaxID=31246 RepID=A0A183NQ96_9TREM|nr:unnamed protein product [Schistosoma mattheei]
MKKVKEGYSRIATGFYSQPYLITSLAIVSHHLLDPSQGVVEDQKKPVLCSFLSFHDTISYTDHLSACSDQSRSRQIMHDVEFSGTTFVEHVQATEMFRDGDTNWIIASKPEHTMPNLCITNMVLLLDISNPSEKTIIKRRVV